MADTIHEFALPRNAYDPGPRPESLNVRSQFLGSKLFPYLADTDTDAAWDHLPYTLTMARPFDWRLDA